MEKTSKTRKKSTLLLINITVKHTNRETKPLQLQFSFANGKIYADLHQSDHRICTVQ